MAQPQQTLSPHMDAKVTIYDRGRGGATKVREYRIHFSRSVVTITALGEVVEESRSRDRVGTIRAGERGDLRERAILHVETICGVTIPRHATDRDATWAWQRQANAQGRAA